MGGVHGERCSGRSARWEEYKVGGVQGGRSAWREECMVGGVHGGRSAWWEGMVIIELRPRDWIPPHSWREIPCIASCGVDGKPLDETPHFCTRML